MANGLYNIRTGEFKSHDPTYLSLIQIPVIYDPAAKCPIIDEIFSVMIRAEDLPKIYEFMGYVLYRTYELQKSFFLLGPGGTGKSYFLDVVLGLVG
jgi:putative DNA primase/helicase